MKSLFIVYLSLKPEKLLATEITENTEEKIELINNLFIFLAFLCALCVLFGKIFFHFE
jgi:hypothetical protein